MQVLEEMGNSRSLALELAVSEGKKYAQCRHSITESERKSWAGCFSQSLRLQGPLCPSGRDCLSMPCEFVPTVCHVPCADDCVVICGANLSRKFRHWACRFELPISRTQRILISFSAPFSQVGNGKTNDLLKHLAAM